MPQQMRQVTCITIMDHQPHRRKYKELSETIGLALASFQNLIHTQQLFSGFLNWTALNQFRQ
jgi:alpha-D-ribose 1-methylphosphonate 5-triphosphate diphosphatase PhnM